MRKVVLRADGSSKMGLGHIMRCIAISQMLGNDFLSRFAIFNPDPQIIDLLAEHQLSILKVDTQQDINFATEFEAVILDGYWFDASYVKKLKARNKRLIQLDDLAGPEFYADIILNHAIGANYDNSILHNCKHLLTGSNYAMLRKEFLGARSDKQRNFKLENITVSMGGADPYNYTLQLVKTVRVISPGIKLKILLGASYAHKADLNDFIKGEGGTYVQVKESLSAEELVDLLRDTALFLCSASTVVYEALAVGVPTACFLTAKNQEKLYEGLLKTNTVEGLGELTLMSEKEIHSRLTGCFNNYKQISEKVENQKAVIDGFSGKRIKEAVLSLWN